jgi:hypothetical protein
MDPREYQKQLQFSDRWLQLGLLTEDELGRLGREYEVSEDKNTEHYRYSAFCKYLTSHSPLPPTMAAALYELGLEDPDQVMGAAMMRDIVGLEECPAELLEKALTSGENHLVKAASGRKLLAELNSVLTEDVFARCLENGDAYIQRELLARSELTRSQLEQLAETGCNRAVRNMAAVRLRDRHYAS